LAFVLVVREYYEEAIIALIIIAKYAMMPYPALFIVHPVLESPCARSRARRLTLDVGRLNIFRLLKALPSGNYRNILMRLSRIA
jgi:hypothetical protein